MDQNRVAAVADAIATLGYDGIVEFDSSEPEHDVIVSAVNEFDDDAHLGLLFTLAATEDYQLAGDAQEFWSALEERLDTYDQLSTVPDVTALLADFMDAQVNARLNDQKKDRLVRIIDNGFGEWFVSTYPDHDPDVVWEQLADSLETTKSKKTVVFAMKVYDIFRLVVDGEYLALPVDVPIPCDLQVKRVASAAGLVDSEDEDEVMDAWSAVMAQVNDELDRPVSMLRIDSIVWQAGQIISTHDDKREPSRRALRDHFSHVGLESEAADRLARELTDALVSSEETR